MLASNHGVESSCHTELLAIQNPGLTEILEEGGEERGGERKGRRGEVIEGEGDEEEEGEKWRRDGEERRERRRIEREQ